MILYVHVGVDTEKWPNLGTFRFEWPLGNKYTSNFRECALQNLAVPRNLLHEYSVFYLR